MHLSLGFFASICDSTDEDFRGFASVPVTLLFSKKCAYPGDSEWSEYKPMDVLYLRFRGESQNDGERRHGARSGVSRGWLPLLEQYWFPPIMHRICFYSLDLLALAESPLMPNTKDAEPEINTCCTKIKLHTAFCCFAGKASHTSKTFPH